MQLCEYSDYSEIHLFLRSFPLQIFPNICTEAFIWPFFFMLWPYLQNIYATTDLREGFGFECTAPVGERGSEMGFSDGEQS